jgi:hypothetical protein
MAAANYTAMVVEALAGPVFISAPLHQAQKTGSSAVPAPKQYNAAPREFCIPVLVMALPISWSARFVFSEAINLWKVSSEVWAHNEHFKNSCISP